MGLTAKESGKILYIELDNLNQGNSFGLEEAKDLETIYRQWKNCPLSGIIFSSVSERFFCAGGNLKFYGSHTKKSQGITANRKITTALQKLSKWPVATVAIVSGDCFGGGMELLSCFDHVVATPTSFFGLWQRKIGLSYGWGGGKRFLQKVSQRKLLNLSLSAKSFPAIMAHKMGWIDDVVAKERIDLVAVQWLKDQSNWPVAPLKTFKRFQASKERSLFEALWWNKEHKKILNKIKNRINA